ncbi:calcium-binding protein [Kineobactrum salinum]|uniref:Calcium-binding protein n=1 Tax=Kineobactrum salinum TaxID=2708301 RepID=A0A6C0TZF4_9GAMM|nr:calcium-binding protein [Kineobactrum salinum]QIB64749.1 calcium-binding protein [Kineobactrum salinum]
MASLKLSDAAFGTLGLTISENLDLAQISQDLSELLGVPYQIDSLDLSEVTRTGLSLTGSGLPDSAISVGNLNSYQPVDAIALNGFAILQLTEATIASDGVIYDITDGELFAAQSETFLSYDSVMGTFDFSATGTAALDILVGSVAPFDAPGGDFPYSGYRIIGNAGDNIFYGNSNFDPSYAGSNSYFAGAGDDVFVGALDTARVEGGEGADILLGGTGEDELYGHLRDAPAGDPDAPYVYVADGDLLFGGDGFDYVDGGVGNDHIYASAGRDTLVGGEGRDRFYFADNYDIPTGLALEILPYTGPDVSNENDSGPDIVEDFNAAQDLLVFPVYDTNIDLQFASMFSFFDTVDEFDQPVVNFEISDQSENLQARYVVEDGTDAMGLENLLVQVEQSSDFTDGLLDLTVEDLNTETNVPLSFEVVYRSPGQSQGGNYDIFSGLDVDAVVPDSLLGGQDKFNLIDLGITDYLLDPGSTGVGDPGSRVPVQDILFTFVGLEGFTYETLGEGQDSVAEDFFFDAGSEAFRGLRVEYRPFDPQQEGQDAIAVYVDADGDGDFRATSDLAFTVFGLSGDFAPGELTAADLYDDPLADGSGTGIFLFEERQYDLWFNDVG